MNTLAYTINYNNSHLYALLVSVTHCTKEQLREHLNKDYLD